jgi:hypothetical protein
MPAVLREDGFVVVIFHPPREHGPAHVHVFKGEGEVIIELDPIEVREVYMRTKDAVAAVELVDAHRAELLDRWREIHG